jgi:hypothetical protein
MTAVDPDIPPYELRHIQSQPFPERMRLICRTWAYQINKTPAPVYLGYLFKIVLLYVGGWWFFCSFNGAYESAAGVGAWAFEATAFQKAILWSLLYEGLGLGCSTGPMTGRFIPPIGGALYFLRPGATKLPLFPGLPVFGGTRRSWLDVALYGANCAFLLRALLAPELSPTMLLPMLVLLPLLGVTDKTIFLASRGEHYFIALVCLAFASGDDLWVSGCKLVWVAIWIFAATSKLNQHFSSVICVMLTNSPVVPDWLRHRLFKSFPDDLRPSRLATAFAHMGTVTELSFPMLLLYGDGGVITVVALCVMLSFHCFISGNMPMGMPVEWNVAMVYGAFFLFGYNAEVSVLSLASMPLLLAFLLFMLVAIPIYGNFVPSRISFLFAMRYYAGNWAYSVWFFRGDSQKKLDRLVKPAPLMRDQLARLIDDEDMIESSLMMTPSFRLMHLQGRALFEPLLRVVDDIDAYEWVDGEIVAGLVLGWNFGDGHLHDLQLLDAIQAQCGFEEGELRVILVESQPLFGSSMAWTIADAATGVLERGESKIAEMAEWQPWPTGEHAAAFARRTAGTVDS